MDITSRNQLHASLRSFLLQAERQRKEDADAHRKAEDEAKKKIALSSMGSGYSSILQRVVWFVSSFKFGSGWKFVMAQL